MKKFVLLSGLFASSFLSYGQGVTALHENFDVDCVVDTSGIPSTSGWLEYTPTSVPDSGEWKCTPTLGRPSLVTGIPTPGMKCSGVFNSAFNLDTSFLITPLLNFSGYPNHIYLQFDTKTTKIRHGSNLTVLVVLDTSTYDTTAPTVDLDSALSPVFGEGDSSGWVTHEVDLSAFKASPFYVAFRYTSTTDSGSIWYLDNVNTSTTLLHVTDVIRNELPLTVIGNSTENNITLSFTTPLSGEYYLAVCDLIGRVRYKNTVSLNSGAQTYNITGLDLAPGMYFVKMGDGNMLGTAKVVVR